MEHHGIIILGVTGKTVFSIVGVGTYDFEADGFEPNKRGGA